MEYVSSHGDQSSYGVQAVHIVAQAAASVNPKTEISRMNEERIELQDSMSRDQYE